MLEVVAAVAYISHMLSSTAGDTLRHARWAKGWSIQTLAQEAKVSLNLIVKIEAGNRNVLGQKVYAIAEALGIDPEGLFEAEATG